MDCIAWSAAEINDHHHCIDQDELLYEDDSHASELIIDTDEQGTSLWNSQTIKEITNEDMSSADDERVVRRQQRIHPTLTSHSKRKHVELRSAEYYPLERMTTRMKHQA